MQFGIRFVRSRNDIWTFCKAKDLGLAKDIGLNIIDEYIKFRGVENDPDKHNQIMYHLDDTVDGLEDTLRLQFGIEMARKAGVFDTVSQVLVDVSKMPHLSSAFSWKFTKSNRVAYKHMVRWVMDTDIAFNLWSCAGFPIVTPDRKVQM